MDFFWAVVKCVFEYVLKYILKGIWFYPQKMALNISLICFNDISNAINVSRNDQNTFHFINLQPSSFPIAAHAKLP